MAGAVIAESEIKVKRSRFVARIYHCASEPEAYFLVNEVKKEYRGASHWVYAYVIGDVMRSSDNGEPPGTGGLPVLSAVRSAKLNNVICIVTRWFGGTKLGVPRLRDAYRKAADAVCGLL